MEGCSVAAGLSLGEYCALVFAGAMSFEDGLKVGHADTALLQPWASQTLVAPVIAWQSCSIAMMHAP